MKLYEVITTLLLLVFLVQASDAQKRTSKSGRKKAEGLANAANARPKAKRTTTTTTAIPTVAAVEEEEEEEVYVEEEIKNYRNLCPPELKQQENTSHPCLCRDEFDSPALMVECVALTSAGQMHHIFNTLLLGKKIDVIQVRNSTLGSTIQQMMGQSYVRSIWMRGNEITDIDNETFQGSQQNVRRLDLGSNLLTDIDFSIFDTFTQLQVLNLGKNRLTSIQDAGNAASLRVLYLYANNIKSIGSRAFYRLEALEYLDLRWNSLQVISSAAFQISSNRWQLRLRSNQISSLEDIFGIDNLPYLIELGGNNIATLTDVVYGPLTEVAMIEGSKIYLGDNPIRCDCSIAWLVTNHTLLSTVVGAKCDGNGMPIKDVNINNLRDCPAPKAWISPLARIYAEFAKESENQ